MIVALFSRSRYSGMQTSRFLLLSRAVVPSCGLATGSTASTLASRLSELLLDPSLIKTSSSEKSTFPVHDPAEPASALANVPAMNHLDARDAIQRSHDVLPSWRDETTAAYRGSLLTKWSSLIKENVQDLSLLVTLESGKPLTESKGEVSYAASFLDYYAGEAIRPTGAGGGFMVPSSFSGPITSGGTAPPRGHIMAIQQAVGVTALITPWNFPLAMITRKVGPALAAGCTAVIKPSELTPLSAVALCALADRAGIPSHVLQLV